MFSLVFALRFSVRKPADYLEFNRQLLWVSGSQVKPASSFLSVRYVLGTVLGREDAE